MFRKSFCLLKLHEQMLNIMIETVKEVPADTLVSEFEAGCHQICVRMCYYISDCGSWLHPPRRGFIIIWEPQLLSGFWPVHHLCSKHLGGQGHGKEHQNWNLTRKYKFDIKLDNFIFSYRVTPESLHIMSKYSELDLPHMFSIHTTPQHISFGRTSGVTSKLVGVLMCYSQVFIIFSKSLTCL